MTPGALRYGAGGYILIKGKWRAKETIKLWRFFAHKYLLLVWINYISAAETPYLTYVLRGVPTTRLSIHSFYVYSNYIKLCSPMMMFSEQRCIPSQRNTILNSLQAPLSPQPDHQMLNLAESCWLDYGWSTKIVGPGFAEGEFLFASLALLLGFSFQRLRQSQ